VGEDVAALASRLYVDVMAPLVLGGELRPGRPIGARLALSLGEWAGGFDVDADLVSQVALGRIRVARRLAPVDVLPPPTAAEWALAAALHDLLQATHPGLDSAFRRRVPDELCTMVDETTERVPTPVDVGEALARHTWLSRVFEVARTDTTVSFWVGEQTFIGTPPPDRLMLWPDLRRVRVQSAVRSLLELPSGGGALREERFVTSLATWLSRSPLTDISTCARSSPVFAWTPHTLTMIATHGGRALALRALGRSASAMAVDAALGRATRPILRSAPVEVLGLVFELLGERLLGELLMGASTDAAGAPGTLHADAALSRGIGALVAKRRLAGVLVRDDEQGKVRSQLEALVTSPSAKMVEALVERVTP
jgi:hypothetical protein